MRKKDLKKKKFLSPYSLIQSKLLDGETFDRNNSIFYLNGNLENSLGCWNI